MSRVAIIGGGISGLAAAYYCSRDDSHECILIEQTSRLGGVIRTELVDGCLVEAGPDSFVAQKPWALELIRELGLEADVIRSNDNLRKTYILRRGQLVPMPDGLYLMVPTAVRPLVASSLLGWSTKLKMAFELLRRPSKEPPDRSVADFVRDHYGAEAVDYLAEPLLAGIYGGDAADLSILSVLPRFVEWERRYGSVTRGLLANRPRAPSGEKPPLFLSLKNGMQQLIDALERAVAGRVRIAQGQAHNVEPLEDGYRISVSGQTLETGHLIVATPAHAAAALLGNVDEALAGLLAGIRYHSSVTVVLGYDGSTFRHPLNGFGFLVPKVERDLLAACTWVGTKFPHRVRDDRVLLRAFVPAGIAEILLERPDDFFVSSAREELSNLMAVNETPRFTRIYRWQRSMAQYTVGHEKRVADIKARLALRPTLQLAGNAYLGIGVPDCIHTAQLAAAALPTKAAAPV